MAGAVVLACNGSTLPPPGIVSVNPAERPASSSGPVTITVDAVLPTRVDYGASAVTVDDRLTLKIGPRTFGPPVWTDGGVVTEFFPSVLAGAATTSRWSSAMGGSPRRPAPST